MKPVESLFPRPEPRPVPGCAVCLRHVRARHRAREAADLSGVSDANVLLRRHQAAEHQPTAHRGELGAAHRAGEQQAARTE